MGPAASGAKEALLAEIKQANRFFHGTVVAQAQRIELVGDRLVFAFPPGRQTLAGQLKAKREWLETLAAKVVGRRLTVEAVEGEAAHEHGAQELAGAGAGPGASGAGPGGPAATAAAGAVAGDGPPAADGPDAELRARALGEPVVKAMLELFPVEITDVEKI